MASPQSETSLLPNTGPFTDELRSIYLDFMDRMGFDNSADACSPESCLEVDAAVTALCASYIDPAVIRVSSGFPALVCKLHPVEAQVTIAHYTALVMSIDDLSQRLTGEAKDVFLKDLALFQMKMCDPQGYATAYPGRGDLHPSLEDFMHYLRTEQNPFFPAHPDTLSMLVKSSLDFLQGNLLEVHYRDNPMDYMPEMHLFCNFLRQKSGVSEAFASFVIMDTSGSSTSQKTDVRFYYKHLYPLVPEVVDGFNLINDVLSFYKEVQDGDTAITILINAKVKKLSPLDALREVIDYLVEQRIRVLAIIEESGSLEWKNKIQQYYQGTISWHVGGSRYRLKELLGDWYQGEYWT